MVLDAYHLAHISGDKGTGSKRALSCRKFTAASLTNGKKGLIVSANGLADGSWILQ